MIFGSIEHNGHQVQGQLSTRLNQWQSEQMETAATIAIQSLADLQTMSPVRTGRYKSSHTFSIGEPEPIDIPKGDYVSGGEMDKRVTEAVSAASQLRGLKAAKMYISNNVEYGQVIEHGARDRAPLLVYSRARQLAEERIKRVEGGGSVK